MRESNSMTIMDSSESVTLDTKHHQLAISVMVSATITRENIIVFHFSCSGGLRVGIVAKTKSTAMELLDAALSLGGRQVVAAKTVTCSQALTAGVSHGVEGFLGGCFGWSRLAMERKKRKKGVSGRARDKRRGEGLGRPVGQAGRACDVVAIGGQRVLHVATAWHGYRVQEHIEEEDKAGPLDLPCGGHPMALTSLLHRKKHHMKTIF